VAHPFHAPVCLLHPGYRCGRSSDRCSLSPLVHGAVWRDCRNVYHVFAFGALASLTQSTSIRQVKDQFMTSFDNYDIQRKGKLTNTDILLSLSPFG